MSFRPVISREAAIASYITEVTRRRLVEVLGRMPAVGSHAGEARAFLAPRYTLWSGALEETDFMARLYDLDRLPSTDRRYSTAFEDMVQHRMKNLIFAAVGPKPEIVLDDADNNDLHIVRGAQGCLVYDRSLAAHGLTWAELTAWWADRQGMTTAPERDVSRSLYQRLAQSLGNNGAERRILHTYAKRYVQPGPSVPALIPQVYLYYDPYTQDRYLPGEAPLQRQRTDFLMLLPNRVRVVIECDGKQHYAEADGLASPRRYAAMMAEDRDLRLRGYEIYRFGGHELVDDPATTQLLDDFFDRLLARYT